MFCAFLISKIEMEHFAYFSFTMKLIYIVAFQIILSIYSTLALIHLSKKLLKAARS